MNIEDRNVKGYAIVFNSKSNILQTWTNEDWVDFIETVSPSAFDNLDLSEQDIILNLEHSDVFMLARNSSDTLRLSVDSTGLFVDADIPNTSLGNDVLELNNRGDLTQMSARWRVEKDRWFRDENNMLNREILEFKHLKDVALVSRPAYSMTYIQEDKRNFTEEDKRSLQNFLEDEKRNSEQEKKKNNNVMLSEYYIQKYKYM